MATDPQNPALSADELKALRFGFDDVPLEEFRGKTAEEIEAYAGIGPKFRERIQAHLAQLESLEAASAPAAEAVAAPAEPTAHHHAPDAALEPVAPGNGGVATVVIILALLAIIVAAVLMNFQKTSERNYKEDFEAAQATIADLTDHSEAVARQALGAAGEESLRVFQRAVEGNFGLARDHVQVVRALLTQLKSTRVEQAEFQGRVAAALAACEKAGTALQLVQPMSQDQVEAACRALSTAVAAIEPQEAHE